MSLTRRITIRLTQAEYDAITDYSVSTDMSYSQLFLEAIRPHIKALPPRTYWHSGEQTRRQIATFHETIDFYKDFFREET